jgi:nicotinamide mononucleotide transporter
MQDIVTALVSLEGLAVVTALAYLLLAARESLWCWLWAGISSALYVWIFWNARLYMESMLNVYYVVMALWGWWSWRYGGQQHAGLRIRTLPWRQHCVLLAAILGLALVNGGLARRYTAAAMPFMDSLVTWGAVLTTALVVRKVLENWVYWLVIDSVSLWLYLNRGLYLTALLFAAYLVLVLFGLRTWWRQYRQESADKHETATPEVA